MGRRARACSGAARCFPKTTWRCWPQLAATPPPRSITRSSSAERRERERRAADRRLREVESRVEPDARQHQGLRDVRARRRRPRRGLAAGAEHVFGYTPRRDAQTSRRARSSTSTPAEFAAWLDRGAAPGSCRARRPVPPARRRRRSSATTLDPAARRATPESRRLRRRHARRHRAARSRRAAAPEPEDGGHRPAGRRHRARLQQPAHGHPRLRRLARRATWPATTPRRSRSTEIQKAAERAADLTRQLLAFSRRQMLQPAAINLVAARSPICCRCCGGSSASTSRSSTPTTPTHLRRSWAIAARSSRSSSTWPSTPATRCRRAAGSTIRTGERVARRRSDVGAGRRARAVRAARGRATPASAWTPTTAAAHLRAVLHDQGGRPGHRPRAVDGLRHRQADGRHDRRREPAGPRHDVPALLSADGRALAAGGRQRVGAGVAARRHETLLLVEDETAVRTFLTHVLEPHGYRVLAAEHPTAALRADCRRFGDPIRPRHQPTSSCRAAPGRSWSQAARTGPAGLAGALHLRLCGQRAGAARRCRRRPVTSLQKPFSLDRSARPGSAKSSRRPDARASMPGVAAGPCRIMMKSDAMNAFPRRTSGCLNAIRNERGACCSSPATKRPSSAARRSRPSTCCSG